MPLEAYPRFYREIDEMVEDVALETPTARAVARKAGLRSVRSDETAPTGGIATILDAWVVPSEVEFEYQWFLDLTDYTRFAFTSQNRASDFLYFYYSLDVSQVFNPGDWQRLPVDHLMYDTQTGTGTGPEWNPIPIAVRAPIRLTIGLSDRVEFHTPSDYAILPFYTGPFSMAMQVAR